MLGFIIIATLPAAFIGVLFGDSIADHFRSILSLSVAFTVTATVLLLADWKKEKGSSHQLTWRRALLIGVAQACALVPGLSRSGFTIAAGQTVGLKRSEALDMSFLIALPAIFGATALTLMKAMNGTVALPGFVVSFTGFCTSFIVSLFAILWLKKFVVRHSLGWFAVYLFMKVL